MQVDAVDPTPALGRSDHVDPVLEAQAAYLLAADHAVLDVAAAATRCQA
jgi:hypothetical protein